MRLYLLLILILGISCKSENKKLRPVTYSDFEKFVSSTGYITDAERYSWSFVQRDVYSFDITEGASWRLPDGKTPPSSKKLPVTQVSYNDALAYCKWSGTRLPSYSEYWNLSSADKAKKVFNKNAPISPVDEVNIIGNVWELTSSTLGDSVRLAGGSVFCSISTCDGSSSDRELYVDKETSNLHIGFAVLEP